jgi:hypothetical protein
MARQARCKSHARRRQRHATDIGKQGCMLKLVSAAASLEMIDVG